MKKGPRFFCDNCGYEVGHEVKACPYCGRFFASVRCPVCDYSGNERIFLNGCPLCGYSAPPVSGAAKPKSARAKNRRHPQPLPSWAYILAVIILLVTVFLFSWLITM